MKMKMKNVFLDMNALKRLCLDYDFCKGRYPESLYEGYSLYAHYLKNKDEIISVTEAEWMEEAKKQLLPKEFPKKWKNTIIQIEVFAIQ